MQSFLLFAIFLVPIVSVAREWRLAGTWHFLNPVNAFWLTFVYAGVAQPMLSDDKWIPFYGEAVFLQTLGMFLVLGLSFAVGYGLPFANKLSRVVPDFSAPSTSKVFWTGLILIGIGLLGYWLVMSASGGPAKYLSSPRENTNFELSGYVYTMPRVAGLGLMVLLCHAFSQRSAWLYKASVLALALVNLLWQAYTGTREGTIGVLVVLFGSVYAAQRRNPPLLALALLLPTIFFVFGFIPTYRGGFRDLSFNLTDPAPEVVDRSFGFFSDPDFGDQAPSTYKRDKGPDLWSDFGMAISVAYYVPDRVDYDYGYMLLEVITHGIPRAVWSSKIYPESEAWDRFHQVSHISESINLSGFRAGPSPTMVGKYFYVGGWLGLVLGGLFSGLCFRTLWEFLSRQIQYVTGVILLVASAGLGGMEMIHPLAWSVYFWLPTVFVPFLLFVWLTRDPNVPTNRRAVKAAVSDAPARAPMRRVARPLTPNQQGPRPLRRSNLRR